MAGINYRNQARIHFEAAERHLGDNNGLQSLRYAALELRLALECLVYQKATNYKDELSTEKLTTWQARKLLQLLMEYDDTVDKDSSISVQFGGPGTPYVSMGIEYSISMKEVRKHYDALGSFLHAPTMNQPFVAEEKLRSRAFALSNAIRQILQSSIWNLNFRSTTSIDCTECGTRVVRRVSPGQEHTTAECVQCAATYDIVAKEDNHLWRRRGVGICSNISCPEPTFVLERDLKPGYRWRCKSCEAENELRLTVRAVD